MLTLHLDLELDIDKEDDDLIETVIDNLKWHLEIEKEIGNIKDYEIRR